MKRWGWIPLIAGAIAVVLLASFAVGGFVRRGTSDAELTRLARAVPVPAGVTLVSPEHHQTVTPGLFTHYRIVNLIYSTTLSCQDLLSQWRSLLETKKRSFTQGIAPNTGGVVVLKLTDTPVNVGVALEGDPSNPQTQCGIPHVDAEGSRYHSF